MGDERSTGGTYLSGIWYLVFTLSLFSLSDSIQPVLLLFFKENSPILKEERELEELEGWENTNTFSTTQPTNQPTCHGWAMIPLIHSDSSTSIYLFL
jgi:hypothetical protein